MSILGKIFLERGANLESRAAHTHQKNTQVPPHPPPPPTPVPDFNSPYFHYIFVTPIDLTLVTVHNRVKKKPGLDPIGSTFNSLNIKRFLKLGMIRSAPIWLKFIWRDTRELTTFHWSQWDFRTTPYPDLYLKPRAIVKETQVSKPLHIRSAHSHTTTISAVRTSCKPGWRSPWKRGWGFLSSSYKSWRLSAAWWSSQEMYDKKLNSQSKI